MGIRQQMSIPNRGGTCQHSWRLTLRNKEPAASTLHICEEPMEAKCTLEAKEGALEWG